jgi:ubiquinone biosynthesis protein
VALSTQIFRKFPFSAPDYGWEDVVSENDTVAFNCTRCQVAEYFKQHDLGEFCYETWCKLDFPLAAQWGSKLDRKASIAIGAEVCDFRWTVPSKQEG